MEAPTRFMDKRLAACAPYTPGEQPQAGGFIKLNTNESPFAPSPSVAPAVAEATARLRLYPDPEARLLTEELARQFGLQPGRVAVGNGSDELLAFSFYAFCPNGVAFPDVTYGFYNVYCGLFHIPAAIVPLQGDFSLLPEDYINFDNTLFIANPNAPTGMVLSRAQIEQLLRQNKDRLVVVDEAYVDFGAESAVPLLAQYDNLLVIGTFSKSRALAGGRLGYAVGSEGLISVLNRVKYSFNPYNVNGLTQAAALAALRDTAYFDDCRNKIIATRQRTQAELCNLGFACTASMANFLFVEHGRASAENLQLYLREKRILVRWFDAPRIKNRLRVSIGTDEQMDAFLSAVKEYLTR